MGNSTDGITATFVTAGAGPGGAQLSVDFSWGLARKGLGQVSEITGVGGILSAVLLQAVILW